MKIAAVITEYNPFHNGHLYQLQKIKENGADCIIIVMSGNFTQRGIPAIYDKFTRTKMALQNGADLVLELPLYYATGSAEFFATGAVTLLNQLGIVDELYFGSETGNLELLSKCAHIFIEEPPIFKEHLSNYLRCGHSFPKARAFAITDYLGEVPQDYDSICNQPNNILGIEYLKALIRTNSSITPVTIKREGEHFHSTLISPEIQQYASANAIRNALLHDTEDIDSLLKNHIPPSVYQYILSNAGKHTLFDNDFSSLIYYQLQYLLYMEKAPSYYDVNSQLLDIFRKNISAFESWNQYVLSCKSKEYTYTRLNRALLHILLHMSQDAFQCFRENGDIFYARLLGFSTNGTTVMKKIKANSNIPMISKLSTASTFLSECGKQSILADIYASSVYYGVRSCKYKIPIENEYQKQIIKV